MTKQEAQTPTPKSRKRQKKIGKLKPLPPKPRKMETIERSSDMKVSYPRLRLEIIYVTLNPLIAS